jgi:uncharacterized protein YbjT (DUF2867 family)
MFGRQCFRRTSFFLAWAAEQIARDGTVRLPFGSGRTSPVATKDVAEVVASVLLDPLQHVGKTYELTGPRLQDPYALAEEYSAALGRSVAYIEVPLDEWRDQELRGRGLPEHVFDHFLTMAHLHAANRYDRLSPQIEAILARPPRSLEAMVQENREMFSAGWDLGRG